MNNFNLGFNDIKNNCSNMDDININNYYAPINPPMDTEEIIRLKELQWQRQFLLQQANYLLGGGDWLFPVVQQPEEREILPAGAEQENNFTAENGMASYLQYPIEDTFSFNTDSNGELLNSVFQGTGAAVVPPIPAVSEIPYPLAQQWSVTKAVVHPTVTVVASTDPPPLDQPVINLPVAPSQVGSASGFGAEQQNQKFTAAEKRKAITIDLDSENENNSCEDGQAQKKDSSVSLRAAHTLSERRRRDRISENMKALQECVPNANKSDKASMLKDAIAYLKSLEVYKQAYTMNIPMMIPVPGQGVYPAQLLNPERPFFAVYPAKLQNTNQQAWGPPEWRTIPKN